jgi:hypothetical protein
MVSPRGEPRLSRDVGRPAAGSAGDVASWLFHLAAFVGPLALGILVIQRYAKTR